MALITCPDCASDISDKATACVKCGAPIKSPYEAQKNSAQLWGFVISLPGFFLFFAAIGGFFTAAEIKIMTLGIGFNKAQIESVLQKSGYDQILWLSTIALAISLFFFWFGVKKFSSVK
jgi:hypothetical protein